MGYFRCGGDSAKSTITQGVAIRVEMNSTYPQSASYTVTKKGTYYFYCNGVVMAGNTVTWSLKKNGTQIRTITIPQYQYIPNPTLFSLELNAGDVITLSKTTNTTNQGIILTYTCVE